MSSRSTKYEAQLKNTKHIKNKIHMKENLHKLMNRLIVKTEKALLRIILGTDVKEFHAL